MIKHFGPKVIQNITNLFNKCMKNGCFPTIWNEAHVLPIPKPMKDHNNPNNYRPIAISSCLGRVLEKILANRLQHFCIKNKIFNNFQCGFQLNRCCDDVLTTFVSDIQCASDMITDIDVVFTDFSKAYDRVWHNGLLYKLIENGVTGNILNVLKQFLQTRQTKVGRNIADSDHGSFVTYLRNWIKRR